MQKLKSRQVTGVTPEITPKLQCKFRFYTKYNTKIGVKLDFNRAHDR